MHNGSKKQACDVLIEVINNSLCFICSLGTSEKVNKAPLAFSVKKSLTVKPKRSGKKGRLIYHLLLHTGVTCSYLIMYCYLISMALRWSYANNVSLLTINLW